jgi:glycerophosphoryl diester phosphodiesterase
VPTLKQLLRLVGGRVPLLLEVKVAGDLWRWMPALLAGLSGYGGSFGVMSFEPRLGRLLRTNAPDWRRGLVVADSLSRWKRQFALLLADPDFVAVQATAAARPWVTAQRRHQPVYSWTVRRRAERQALSDRVDALIWEGDGRP